MFVSKRFYKILLRLIIIGILISPFYSYNYLFALQEELVCGNDYDQQAPAIAYADSDSYLIVWQDYRSSDSFDIYGSGSNEGEKFGPVPICKVSRDQKMPKVAWNGTNYLVIWEDNRNGNFFDIYGMRLSKGGALLDGVATSGGKPISSASGDQIHGDIVWNGKDCFLVVWQDNRNGNVDIYGTRVSPEMALYDGPALDGGIPICVRTGDQKSPAVAWNGTNFLVIWEDHISADVTDIRGRRLSQAGNILDDTWDSGLVISADRDIQRNPDVASNGYGYFVVWDRHTPSDGYPNIYGIFVEESGAVSETDPIAVSTAIHNQVNPAVEWTGGNYICIWKDDREGMVDVYWTRINSQGQLLNNDPQNGGVSLDLTHASCIYTSPAASFVQGRGLVIWDENASTDFDIYASLLIPPIPPQIQWANLPGYVSDGVEPDQGFGGETYTFLVLYKDTEASVPQVAQVVIDTEGDGDFSSSNDLVMTMTPAPEEINPDYLSGVIYQAEVVLEYEWDEEIYYYFHFNDGTDDAVGVPTEISLLLVKNNPPVLSWSQSAGYYSDGVDPNRAEGSFTFRFMVDYQDEEGDPPEVAEVWIDLDDSGTYEQRERFLMQEADQEEFAIGRDYKKSVKILYAGDGRLNYRFVFSDSYNLASGDPTKNQTLIVEPHLKAPILSWPIESGFVHGAKIGTGELQGQIIFKIGYYDPDNDVPVTSQVWADLNGDGTFTENEKFKMSQDSNQKDNFVQIRYYLKSMQITYSGDGDMFYKFVFDDGWNIATGEPFLEGAFITLQSPVTLCWPSIEGFETDGVKPDAGYKGSSFEFRVIYVNQNGYPPVVKEIWLDENLDGEYQQNERYRMEDANSADIDYKDGKEYIKTIQYNGQATGFIPYKFVFNDIYMEATGDPSKDYLAIELLSGSNPQDPNSSDVPPVPTGLDEDSMDMYNELGKGCFICSLNKNISAQPESITYQDPTTFNSTQYSLNVWIKLLKLSLLVLIIMGTLMCIVLYRHCCNGGR